MTNGEKFKQIFPNIQIDMGEIYIYVWIDHEPAHITKDWWNAEYKEPTTNNDVPDNNVGKIAPTTKNDLGADCISRAEAIDTIRQLYLDLATQKAVIDLLKILPSVTPQEPRWIPTSERLPNSDNEVLCWYEYYHWSQEKVLPEYGLGRYFKETKAWFGEVANGKDVRVIAWMPLPALYEPQESEEE